MTKSISSSHKNISTISTQIMQLFNNPEQWEELKSQFWQAKPYPHICFDNFLPSSLFAQVTQNFQQIDQSATPTEIYSSDIELNKVCFESSNKYAATETVVNTLASPEFIEILESLFKVNGIIPLLKFRTENKSARKYLHIMKDKGFLGSHVDQSHIDQEYIHILSCIFYASSEWTENQGGHTILFNSDGSQSVTQIEYKPNRLAIFLHTSTSFHGVSKLNTNSDRYSIYMDYYLPVNKLKEFKEVFAESTNQNLPQYWEHGVVFFTNDQNSNYFKAYNQYQLDAHNNLKHFNSDNLWWNITIALRKAKHYIKNQIL
ncbi:MAG: 2OG-Fe(II) oxygenase [Pseudanabaenaceae cyanobacterium bins.39]|nr:2OG-Fe(II) oxygenase [Pseudanabaenaceae cyanobacterium bins.39]